MRYSALSAAVLLATMGASYAANHDSLGEALRASQTDLSLRYRYEYVDQDGFNDSAEASTARLRLTFKSGDWKGFSVLTEFDHLAEVWETDYNDKLNGKTAYPVIADPLYTEVNQAYISYKGFKNTEIRYGRQRILLDNQRFVGGVGWRQNEQTYDGVVLVNKSLPDTTVIFASLYNVNNILGKDLTDGQHNILNVKYEGLKNIAVTGYAYLLENISDTYGVRLTGNTEAFAKGFDYTIEYATQSTDTSPSADTDYYLLEGKFHLDGFSLTIGNEVHTTDNGTAFQTPLGTNHAFNGWADKFLTVPGTGLNDIYVGVGSQLLGNKVVLTYHTFSADTGSDDYGTEWDLAISRPIAKNQTLLFKFASYSADTFSTDTDKFWVQWTAKF